jgi:hypothetical protein
MRLDGREQSERSWLPPAEADFEGTTIDGGPSYQLEVVTNMNASEEYRGMASALRLTCRPDLVRVLHAGAILVLERGKARKMEGHEIPWHWEPPATESVSVSRCEVASGDDDAGVDARSTPSRRWVPEGPLVFAQAKNGSPGIEWAYENSDMVVQQGAYRWMPATLPADTPKIR